MHESTSDASLLARLAEGLKNNELLLVYQPKVNMRTGRVIGVEALLRWAHPEQGILAPGVFLPVAEHDDLIVDIGTWVIREALRQILIWQQQNLDLVVSINIAPRQLLHPDFLPVLNQCLLDEPDVYPSRLELEILESAALENTAVIRAIIDSCREKGITFSLDDFGTGYASLAYLRQIPADVLKIDQSFVRDLLTEEDDRLLVSGVIGLAHAFRRVVVAEGVETAAQGALLMRLGCNIAQGYGIARPMAAEHVADWVANYKPDAEWAAWDDMPWDMDDLPLLMARSDQCIYVDQILGYLEGKDLNFQPGELSDHHQCRFGRWYYHQGLARYGDMDEFIELEGVHKVLHELGTEIVRLKDRGEETEAAGLSKKLLLARSQILSRLDSLQHQVGIRVSHNKSPTQLNVSASTRRAVGIKGGNPVQILVVDDTPTNIEVLAGALSREYTVKFATNGEKALEMANRPEKPDLILLDVMMPGMDGYEVCRRLKENPETRNIPVMFITARSDMEDQIRGYQVGGVDFISKPFQIPIVLARVSAQLRLKLHSDLLESRAFIDGLTGIANRRHMDEVLENECRRAQRNKIALSLLMIDVDHFKEYNDHYGHGAGDECLRQIGGVLAMMPMRPGDFVARYGGEEFSVILPGCNITGAQIIAERIRVTIEALNLPHAHSTAARHVTVSIGCATSREIEELTPERLLAAADQALYQAKQQGRNRVVCPLPDGSA